MSMLSPLLVLLAPQIVRCSSEEQPLLRVAADDAGSISVSVGGEVWLRSDGPPWVLSGRSRIALSLVSSGRQDGDTTGLGSYEAQTWEWSGSLCRAGGVALRTELRRYRALPDAAVFVHEFPCGVKSIDAPLSSLASAWPAFEERRGANLSWATFNGHFALDVDRGLGLDSCRVGRQGGTPVMLYDERTMRTLVTSQLTRMKTGEVECAGKLALGLKGSLTSVPAKFTASWVLHAGTGVARTMEGWGDFLLAAGAKQRVSMYEDDIVSSLGYWTDNGAYYHYPIDGPALQAGGYQREIARVHQANQAHRLPFRHWQLDSWWYLKGSGGNGSSRGRGSIGPYAGVYEWVADPFVFPDGGVPAVQKIVGLPFVLHNRWFSPQNLYRSQGIPSSGWTDTFGGVATLPLDVDFFWEYFFQQQKGYGLKVYEQDFLYWQYDFVPALRRNATLADDWLRAMSDAAKRHNLTVQYCMPYPREYIVSTKHHAVTTIRVSDDYQPNNANWRIARQSLLAYSVGLLPFKDTFLSGDTKEAGAANPGPELTPELHTLVSALSGAMVGPGDGPGMANRTRLLRTCMEDGLLLKADRPAVPVDVAWTSRDPGGELSWSFSALPGGRAQRYVLAAALRHNYNLTLSDVELPATRTFVAREWYSGELRLFDAMSPLLLSTTAVVGAPRSSTSQAPVPFQYWTIAEVAHGWVLLGELGKYVTASGRRVRSLEVAADGSLRVGVAGARGERVSLCGLHYGGGAVAAGSGPSPLAAGGGRRVCRAAVVGDSGAADVALPPLPPPSSRARGALSEVLI